MGRRQYTSDRWKLRAAAAAVCEMLEERRLLSVVIAPQFGIEPVTHGNGASLSSPPVYLIFWGSYWNTHLTGAVALVDGAASILSSPFLNMLVQYGSDGQASLGNPSHAYDNPSVGPKDADPVNNNFGSPQIDSVVQNEINLGALPSPNAGPHTGLYVVVTPPNINSNSASAAGFNFQSNGGIPEIWAGTSPNSASDNNPNVNTFTLILSHEIAESMSSLGLGGFEVGPGPTFPPAFGGSGNQIGDYEPNFYSFTEPNGALVQPLWSRQFDGTNNVIIADNGTSQNFNLTPNWVYNNSNSTWGFQQTFSLTVNGDQLSSPNDIITLGKTAAGGVSVTLNGETTTFAPGQISSVTINSGGGQDLIFVHDTVVTTQINSNSPLNGPDDTVIIGDGGNTQGITAPLSITNTSGYDSIDISDSTDTVGRTVTVGAGPTGEGEVSGIAPVKIDFIIADTRSLFVDTGDCNPSGPYTTVNVLATVVPTTITGHTSGPVDNFNVGSDGSVQNIQAKLTLADYGQSITTVNDSADTSNRTVTMANAATGGYGAVTGLGSAEIDCQYALAFFILKTGLGANVLNVQATGTLTYIIGNSHNGNGNTINIGDAGSVQSIYSLTVDDATGPDTITVDDSADTNPRTVTLDNGFSGYPVSDPAPYGSVTGLGSGVINYEYADTSQINIKLGSATDTVNVRATGAALTKLVGGAGTDTFNFSPTVNNLNNIAGSVDVHAGPGPASIFAYDGNYGNQTMYTLDWGFNVGTLNRSGFGGIAYSSVQNFSLVAGQAPDTIDVMDTGPGSTTNIDSAGGLDGVNIGNGGSAQGIQGTVNIRQTAGEGSVNIDDSADTTARAAIVKKAGVTGFGAVTGLAPAEIDYDYLDDDLGLGMNLGSGANTVTIHATGSTPTTFTGGHAKSVQMDSGATATLAGVTVNGGSGGGITNHGVMTVTGSTITGNTRSGGIVNYGALNLVNSNVSNNTTTGSGGGIESLSGGSLIVTGSTVANNTAAVSGGGIYDSSSASTITGDTITGNAATGAGAEGGGLFLLDSAPYLVNCLIVANSASFGSALFNDAASKPKLVNCTVTNNTATGAGGAIYSDATSVATITNSIVYNDLPLSGGSEIRSFAAAPSVVNYTDVAGSYGGTQNIDADPLFTASLTLQASSPCINTGNNSILTTPPLNVTTDLAGNSRILPAVAGTVDMGAYEYSGPISLVLIQGPPQGGVTIPNTLTIVVSPEQGNVVIKDGSTVRLDFYRPLNPTPIRTLQAVVDATGKATFLNITVGAFGAGTYSFTATDVSDNNASLSRSFAVNAAGLPKVAFAQPFPSTVTAGPATFPVTVDLTDSAGNPSNANDLLVVEFNGGAYSAQAQGGMATFNLSTPAPSATPYPIEADDVNFASGLVRATNSITVNPAVYSNVLTFGGISASQPQTAGTPITGLTVTVTNNGNPVNNDPVTLTLTGPAGATLSPPVPSATTNSLGVAAFGGITLGPGGNDPYTIQARDSTGALANLSLSVTTPALTTLVFTQLNSSQPLQFAPFTLGSNLPLTPFQVSVEQNGVVQTGDNTTVIEVVVAIPNSAPYGGNNVVQVQGGVAKFDHFFLGQAAPTTLKASDITTHPTGVPADVPAISNSFIVNPGPAYYLDASAPATTAGSSTVVTVRAEDITHNNFVPTYGGDVTLNIFDSQGNVVATSTVTAQSGIATFGNIVLDQAGDYSLIASGTGVVGGTGSLTVVAAAPAELAFEQEPQTAVVGFPFAQTVSVAVEDQFGNIVTADNSTSVSLSLAGGLPGAGLNGATVATVQSGIAAFGALSASQINPANLPYTLNANDDNSDTPAASTTFNIIAPATIYVDQSASPAGNTGNDWTHAFIDLQSALAAALPGDTIDVAEGDYQPGTDPTDTFGLLGVTLQGGFPTGGADVPDPAANLTTLDGANTNFHVVTSLATSATSYLSGFTISGGYATAAGDANSGFGGGLLVEGGSLSASNCSFNSDYANSGGAIYVDSASVSLNGLIVSGNTAWASNGGGLAIADSATVTVTNSTFTNNQASQGGGVAVDGASTLTVADSTFSENHGDIGGAIYSNGSLSIVNSTFNGNTASQSGGGIYNIGALNITDSTISGNSAPDGSGLIAYNAGIESTVNGSIIAGNLGYLNTPDIDGGSIAGTNDVVGQDATFSFTNGVDGNIVGVTAAQLLLAPLANNGGPTQTMALLAGSPAIGVSAIFNGPNALPVTDDQRGIARGAAAPDIGACQLVLTPPLIITAHGIIGANVYLENDGAGNLDWWVSPSPFFTSPLGSVPPDGTIAIANITTVVQVIGGAGDDVFTVDFSNGSPIPSGGIACNGVADAGAPGDSLAVIGDGSDTGTYTPDSTTTGSGTVTVDGGTITFSDLEPVLASGFAAFSLVTPNGSNDLVLDSPIPGQSEITGTSGGIAIEALSFFNIANLIVDTASNDTPGAADDTMTIAPAGIDAARLSVLSLNVGGGTNSLIVNGGTTTIDMSLGIGGADLSLTLNNTAVVTLPSSQQLAGITLNDSAQLDLTGGGSTVVQTGGLQMAPNATLDMGSSSLVVAYTGASPYAALNSLVNNGMILGVGIITSFGTAAFPVAVGLVDNNLIHQTTWNGTTISDGVDFGQIILKGTYAGDTNLDGQVDQSDYLNIVANMGSTSASYFEGDLNGDVMVTPDDFAIVSANLGAGASFAAGPALPAASPASADATMSAMPADTVSPMIETPAAEVTKPIVDVKKPAVKTVKPVVHAKTPVAKKSTKSIKTKLSLLVQNLKKQTAKVVKRH
ncbi:MAG: right-handed parallel beta-helix repeat-containing protein [Tepidisphaeraceae bacterium]